MTPKDRDIPTLDEVARMCGVEPDDVRAQMDADATEAAAMKTLSSDELRIAQSAGLSAKAFIELRTERAPKNLT